jgi:hypothetical protein
MVSRGRCSTTLERGIKKAILVDRVVVSVELKEGEGGLKV